MHSTALKPAQARGFTLLEIAIVLVIASMIIGLGAMMVSSMLNDNAVAKTVSEIEVLGLEGMKRASYRHRPQAILFHENRCELWDAQDGLIRTVTLPMGSKLLLQRYFSPKMGESTGQRLDIVPGCLMEPLQLVLQTAGSEFGFALDPLTGGFNPNL